MVQIKTLGEKLERPIYVRLKFTKTGKLQYISHLDLIRTMNKILVRSRMPMWYTEGFNPKPKMIFASSMSVGLQSVCEFMDVRITHEIDLLGAVEALNAASTEELCFVDAYYPEEEFTSIAWAKYEITLNTPRVNEDAVEILEKTLSSSPLVVLKRTKSGDKDVDISPSVSDVKAVINEKGEVLITLLLKAENTSFLNPEYLITALKCKTDIFTDNLLDNTYSIVRTDMLLSDMTTFR